MRLVMQKTQCIEKERLLELKWLEDFVAVAEKGHFARAATERFVTQSALSRRIQSLENWVGVELLDRSEHPIQLTAAGHEFIRFARDLINTSYEGRAVSNKYARIDASSVTIASLHTLTLSYVPQLVHKLQDELGHFSASIVAETRTVDEYLTGLSNGSSDFFICYSHEGISLNVDKAHYPSITINQHWVRPFQSLELPEPTLVNRSGGIIPYLEYAPGSYMSRVVEHCLKKAPFKDRLQTVYRASLAESIFSATKNGLGLCWLPETVASGTAKDHGLRMISNEWATPLYINIYKSLQNNNPTAMKIWEYLQANY